MENEVKPKVRTLRFLLDLNAEAERRWSIVSNKMEAIRREVYPLPPIDGWKDSQKRYILSATIAPPSRQFPDRALCVLRFGYTTHQNKLCDSWSLAWHTDRMDAGLLRAYAGIDVSKAPTEPMESLAYEGTLLGWDERWKEVLGHTPENADRVKRYVELDETSRDWRTRTCVIYREIQKIVMSKRPERSLHYIDDREKRYRYVLPDGKVFSSEGDGFYMSDCAKTVQISYDTALSDPVPGADVYGWDKHDGTNRAIKQKRKEAEENARKSSRTGT